MLSGVCTTSRPFLLPPTTRLGVYKNLGGDTAKTADHKAIFHTYGIQSWVRRMKEGRIEVMAFVFPSHHCV